MQSLLNIINNILDPIGIVVGLLLAIPIFWTWYQVVWGNQRRYRQYLRDIRSTPGSRPAIFVVDLLPSKNIRPAVENFCQQDTNLRKISNEYIFHLELDGISEDQVDAFKTDVRKIIGEMYAKGIDRIHYFHAGPSMAAAMVGAELGNFGTVLLYHHEGEGYHNFGLLKLPRINSW